MEYIQKKLSEELKSEIMSGFREHSIEMTGFDGKNPSESFIALEEGKMAGVVVVENFWNALHVKYVFVDKNHRGKGLASKLLKEALEYGKRQKCEFAFVETMSFQAPDFYQKMGFKIDFSRPGYAGGASMYYLSLKLR